MDDSDDVTQWIACLSNGDDAAVQAIWERYFEKLVRFARKKLDRIPRRVADEEDIALSAMQSFCRAAAAGRFPRLNDRHDLWKLLVTITARKAFAEMKRHWAQKRGGGQVRGESVFMGVGEVSGEWGIGQVLGAEPTPEFACLVAETFNDLLDRLAEEDLNAIARYKMEGYTNGEIATAMNCVERTIERKLARIRETWELDNQET